MGHIVPLVSSVAGEGKDSGQIDGSQAPEGGRGAERTHEHDTLGSHFQNRAKIFGSKVFSNYLFDTKLGQV